ncbi:MAG: ATP-binding protein [Acidobacteriota bacterium]|nr:ATP-binding protein [Acidobacteriota bacterium]
MHPGKLRIAAGILLLLVSAIVILDFTVLDQLQPPVASDLRWDLLVAALLITLCGTAIGALIWEAEMRHARRLRLYAEELLGSDTISSHSSRDELEALSRSLRRLAPRIRELNQRIALENARRENILGSMAEGVLSVDSDLRVIFCNKFFAHAAGAAWPVPEQTPLLEVTRDPGLVDIVKQVLVSGTRGEHRVTLSASGDRTFDVYAAPLAGSDRQGAIAVLHDMTHLERLERVRRDFVANVSHELRTPLASIRGYAETLLEGGLEDREHNRKFVEVILSQAIRLNNIASDLLALSEIESNALRPEPHAVSLRAALETALRTVETSARLHDVRLLPGDLPEVQVLGHELRLEQAFSNLLDNAVKFNRPGGEVRLEAAVEGRWALVTVADTGVGISSQDLPRIFERFYRADKARSRETGGTGLGLAIVRHAVEQMGGEVSVESEFGRGSRFTLKLPLHGMVP